MSTSNYSSNYSNDPVIGIDVSKATLDIFLLLQDRSLSFQTANSLAGFRRLTSWLGKQGQTTLPPVCLEATGAYSVGIALHLYRQGHCVWMVNPSQIHAFFHVKRLRTKTDATDARLIAEFARAMAPDLLAWEPRPEAYQALVELVHHLQDLVRDRAKLKNRSERSQYDISTARGAIEGSLKRLLHSYDQQIETVTQAILKVITQDQELSERFERLKTIPGVGNGMAMTFMAEVPTIQRFCKPKELAAYAGLTPRIRHSGLRKPESQPISKMGNASLRQSLYMSALTAKKYNPGLVPLTLRLRVKGKKPKVILVAVMRKLLHQMHAIDTHKINFDPNYQKSQPQRGLI